MEYLQGIVPFLSAGVVAEDNKTEGDDVSFQKKKIKTNQRGWGCSKSTYLVKGGTEGRG